MSLTLRNGIWRVRKMVGTVMIDRSTKTSNKKVAEGLEGKWIAEVHAEVVVKGKLPISLHKALDEFAASRAHMASGDNCRIRLAPFKQITDQALHRVANKESQEVVERMFAAGNAKSTVAASVAYWNAMLKYCEAKGYSACKPLERIKGVKGKIRWITPDEETALLAAVSPHQHYSGKNAERDAMRQNNWDYICLLLDTGARHNEICDMQWNQVDLKKGLLRITRSKGGSDTTLVMTQRVKEIMTRRHDARTDNNVMQRPANEQKWWDGAVKRAKLSSTPSKPTPHTLRHTFAARFLDGGGGLHELQHLLGHVDIESTMVYAHLVKTDSTQKAADIMNALQAAKPAPEPLLRVD